MDPSTLFYKQELYSQFSKIGKAVGNANRFELLEQISQGECSVEALVSLTGLSFANTSQHLRHLHQAGLVLTRKEGQRVFYRLADQTIVDLLGMLRKIAQNNLAEVDKLITTYLTVKDDLEPLIAKDLLDKINNKEVTVLDIRSPNEYERGHLPGAINIPLEELEKHLGELEKDREIIAYCRGPYCILSFEAVKRLRELGFSSRRLQNGFPEWKHAGLPIET